MSGLTWADLESLPVGCVVETGDRLRYERTHDGWTAPHSRRAKSAWLVDSDHSRQPVRIFDGLLVCESCGYPSRHFVLCYDCRETVTA